MRRSGGELRRGRAGMARRAATSVITWCPCDKRSKGRHAEAAWGMSHRPVASARRGQGRSDAAFFFFFFPDLEQGHLAAGLLPRAGRRKNTARPARFWPGPPGSSAAPGLISARRLLVPPPWEARTLREIRHPAMDAAGRTIRPRERWPISSGADLNLSWPGCDKPGPAICGLGPHRALGPVRGPRTRRYKSTVRCHI